MKTFEFCGFGEERRPPSNRRDQNASSDPVSGRTDKIRIIFGSFCTETFKYLEFGEKRRPPSNRRGRNASRDEISGRTDKISQLFGSFLYFGVSSAKCEHGKTNSSDEYAKCEFCEHFFN